MIKCIRKPEDAVEFVAATGVDALAIAIGTNHGQFKSKTEVNLPLLKRNRRSSRCSLGHPRRYWSERGRLSRVDQPWNP